VVLADSAVPASNKNKMKSLQNITTASMLLFGIVAGAQEKKIDKAITDDACVCIGKISLSTKPSEKNEKIRECIQGGIMMGQMNDVLSSLKAATDTLKSTNVNDTVVIKSDKEIIITVDKDYDETRRQLLKECPALKTLMMADNEEQSKHSMSNKDKAKTFYDEGQKYFGEEKYELALVEYNKAVKADPKFTFAWDNMGICYRKLGRYKQAIECYDKSLKVDPKGRVAIMSKATAYNLLEDYKSAGETFEKMIAFYPDDAEGYYGAARMYFAVLNYDKALDYIFKSYMIYKETDSPYLHDAETTIATIYNYMKQENKLDIFDKYAKKYKIQMTD
jgi:tetratricopeptide (TPR) repeat protein